MRRPHGHWRRVGSSRALPLRLAREGEFRTFSWKRRGRLPKPLIACIDPPHGATWRSGYATVCKTVYSGSIPDAASINIINDLR